MNIPKLYQKYFIEKNDEREILFEKIVEKFQVQSGLYPGSFVHITPSLYIKDMLYIDNDKRCVNFFKDEAVFDYVSNNKQYKDKAKIKFISHDFTEPINLETKKFDVLFSFYAGFISQHCKMHLKENGILVVNNSHGDAALAFLDTSFTLIAAINRYGKKFSIMERKLEEYFIVKNGNEIDRNKVLRTMRGPAYTKPAYAYIFEKNN